MRVSSQTTMVTSRSTRAPCAQAGLPSSWPATSARTDRSCTRLAMRVGSQRLGHQIVVELDDGLVAHFRVFDARQRGLEVPTHHSDPQSRQRQTHLDPNGALTSARSRAGRSCAWASPSTAANARPRPRPRTCPVSRLAGLGRASRRRGGVGGQHRRHRWSVRVVIASRRWVSVARDSSPTRVPTSWPRASKNSVVGSAL